MKKEEMITQIKSIIAAILFWSLAVLITHGPNQVNAIGPIFIVPTLGVIGISLVLYLITHEKINVPYLQIAFPIFFGGLFYNLIALGMIREFEPSTIISITIEPVIIGIIGFVIYKLLGGKK